jgi:elongation factor P
MYEASDLRKGLKIELEGVPYVITEFNFVKPGKGQGMYNCRIKNLVTGATMARTFRAADRIGEPKIDERTLRYSYQEGDNYIFLDENFEQVAVPAVALGDSRHFLVEDCSVHIVYHNDRPIEVTLPTFVEKTIIYTEPGARGDTANNVMKPATIEGGYELQVPLFVNQGDIIKIDTRTGEYADRVSRK